MSMLTLPHHMSTMTCGGVTGHATGCDRATCERIIHQNCGVGDVHRTESGEAVLFTTDQRVCVTCDEPIVLREGSSARYMHVNLTDVPGASGRWDHTAEPKLAHPMDTDPFAGIDEDE